jgi:hypothetical protein
MSAIRVDTMFAVDEVAGQGGRETSRFLISPTKENKTLDWSFSMTNSIKKTTSD